MLIIQFLDRSRSPPRSIPALQVWTISYGYTINLPRAARHNPSVFKKNPFVLISISLALAAPIYWLFAYRIADVVIAQSPNGESVVSLGPSRIRKECASNTSASKTMRYSKGSRMLARSWAYQR